MIETSVRGPVAGVASAVSRAQDQGRRDAECDAERGTTPHSRNDPSHATAQGPLLDPAPELTPRSLFSPGQASSVRRPASPTLRMGWVVLFNRRLTARPLRLVQVSAGSTQSLLRPGGPVRLGPGRPARSGCLSHDRPDRLAARIDARRVGRDVQLQHFRGENRWQSGKGISGPVKSGQVQFPARRAAETGSHQAASTGAKSSEGSPRAPNSHELSLSPAPSHEIPRALWAADEGQ